MVNMANKVIISMNTNTSINFILYKFLAVPISVPQLFEMICDCFFPLLNKRSQIKGWIFQIYFYQRQHICAHLHSNRLDV